MKVLKRSSTPASAVAVLTVAVTVTVLLSLVTAAATDSADSDDAVDDYSYSYPEDTENAAHNDTQLAHDYEDDEADEPNFGDVGPQLNETFTASHNGSVPLSSGSNLSTTTAATPASGDMNDSPAVSTQPPTVAAVAAFACPDRCSCPDGTTLFINCSGLALTQIPQPLPANVLQLDLSHNSIAAIAPDTFGQTKELRHLLLHHNQLTAITNSTFAGARRLDNVDLHANQIRHIDASAFADAGDLSNVSLAHNPLQLDELSGPLLNEPDLHTLDLEACGLTDVYNATFRHLTGLVALNLRANPLADGWNVAAFANMSQLAQLRLSALPRAQMDELCRLASAIDVISGDQYDLSCFELMAGQTYEESINTPATTKGPRMAEVSTLRPTFVSTSTSTARQITVPPTSTTSPRPPATGSVSTNNPSHADKAHVGQSNNTSPVSGDHGAQDAAAPTASNAMRTILMLSIGLAVVALLVGIGCRADVFGVKTKLCRTRAAGTRGPAATDQVRPAERAPLKDIELKEIKQTV